MNRPRYNANELMFKHLHDLQGRELEAGKDKNNKNYTRRLNYEPGYEGLLDIVAGLQKEVKRINQCLTLEGAQAYASKRKNWQAYDEDITGPNGKPDGIKEVIVTDAKGNLKVINGYGLTKTQYPIRKAYRTLYPTKEERDENHYTDFRNSVYELSGGFDDDHNATYKNDPATIGEEFAHIQPEVSSKTVYKDAVFRPIYDALRDLIKSNVSSPMEMAQIFNKGLSYCFKKQMRNPIIEEISGLPIDNLDEKSVNKILRSKDYKEALKERIFVIATSDENLQQACEECNGFFSEFLDNGGELTSPYKDLERNPTSPQKWVQNSPQRGASFRTPRRQTPETPN